MPFAQKYQVEFNPTARPSRGLLSVVSPSTPADPHWQAGVEWENLPCLDVLGRSGPNCDPSKVVGVPKKFAPGAGLLGEAEAFALYAGWKCSPVGYSDQQATDRVLAIYQRGEERALEHAVWTGEFGNRGFAPKADTLTTGVSAVMGLAVLEEWAGDNAYGQGIIHADVRTVTVWASKGLVQVVGGQVQTKLGTPVVAGSGYPGTSPAGDAPDAGEAWAYVTPPILALRSDVSTQVGFDRATNDLMALAERVWVVGWESCTDPDTATVNMKLE